MMIRYYRTIALASAILLSAGAAHARVIQKPVVQFAEDGVVIRGDYMPNSQTLEIQGGNLASPPRHIAGFVYIGTGFMGTNYLDLRRGIFIGHQGDGGQACPNGYFSVLDLRTARLIPIPDVNCKEDLSLELGGSDDHPTIVIHEFGKVQGSFRLR